MHDSDQALPDYLGSRQSALGLLLAFLGAGILVALMVVTPQMLGEPGGARWKPWILGIGLWSVIAAFIGLRLRRSGPSAMLVGLGSLWLAPALVAGAWAVVST
ncbi:hypothetical protein ACIPPQ_13295 [Sphingopyxis sp. LARHCG72]